jgi:hypothetical protein
LSLFSLYPHRPLSTCTQDTGLVYRRRRVLLLQTLAIMRH